MLVDHCQNFVSGVGGGRVVYPIKIDAHYVKNVSLLKVYELAVYGPLQNSESGSIFQHFTRNCCVKFACLFIKMCFEV
jgi:hypothetical protein